MGKTTQLKRSSERAIVVFVAVWALSFISKAERLVLPVMINAGVIPLQVQGDSSRLKDQIDRLAKAYSNAVYASARFNMIGDELVKEMWASPSSRKDLVSDYEIAAFTYLNILLQPDNVQFVARLVDPDFRILLEEQTAVLRADFAIYDEAKLNDFCKNLFYRMINRLPIDVTVTSIQGPYVTLSGGLKQGLLKGESLDLITAEVKSVHPATGSFEEFNLIPVAKAEIIDVTDKAAIAMLTQQEKENGLKIGDGAKSVHLNSRTYFASTLAQRLEMAKAMEAPVLLGAVGVSDAPKRSKPKVESSELPSIAPELQQVAKAEKTPELKAENSKHAELAEKELEAETKVLPKEPQVEKEHGHPMLEVELALSQLQFHFAGAKNAQTIFDWYFPLNRFEVKAEAPWLADLHYALGLGFAYGTLTDEGSFLGLDLKAEVKKRYSLMLGAAYLTYLDVVGVVAFEKMTLTNSEISDTFAIEPGISARAGGDLAYADYPFSWQAGLTWYPTHFGSIGYDGGAHKLENEIGIAHDISVMLMKEIKGTEAFAGFIISARDFATHDGITDYGGYQLVVGAKRTF